MYKIRQSKKFRKGFKRIRHSHIFNHEEFKFILNCLVNQKELDSKYSNHKLKGEFAGYYECHLRPDLLLIYRFNEEEKVIHLHQIGSHSEIFG